MSLGNNMLVKQPKNWSSNYNGSCDGIYAVSRYTNEYDQVEELLKSVQTHHRITIDKIHRVQNFNFYCQFQCRSEYYAISPINYYMVST